MNHTPPSVAKKITDAIAGNSVSLGNVFQYYRPRLMAHALRICGNTPLAQDAVQDTFISAFTNLHTLRNPSMFYPWLKKILVNNCYLLMRREKSTGISEMHFLNDAMLNNSIEKKFEDISNRQRIYDVMQLLSDELRICIMLRYFSAYSSYDEMAEILNIPVGTIRSRLSAAREKLKLLFNQHEDTDDSALLESKQWSDYYFDKWKGMYDDLEARNELFEHHHPMVTVRFTSGKTSKGRGLLESEINNDLLFGTRFKPEEIISSGNLTLIEGPNINHKNSPDRCAPSSAMVLFRNNNRVETLHIFDSQRKLKVALQPVEL